MVKLMSLINIILIVGISTVVIGCSLYRGGELTIESECSFTMMPYAVCRTSIYRIITSPTEFQDRKVQLKGYLASDDGHLKLYSNETTYLYDMDTDAIAIIADPDEAVNTLSTYGKSYVLITGTFIRTPGETDGIHSSPGALRDIVQLAHLSERMFEGDDRILIPIEPDDQRW